MLAYGGAVLDATVGADVHRKGSAISRILGTNPRNIIRASARRASLESSCVSRFSIHKWWKRSDALPLHISDLVTEWWEQVRDTCQRPGGGIVVSHPIHLLLKTQV
jgi:hypothetical protein